MSAREERVSTHADSTSRRRSRPASWTARRQLTRHASISAFVNSATAGPQPVELQVETMSSISTRVFLYTWYAVLIIALVVESNVGLQWVSRNFCGDATVSAYHLEEWNSTSCLSWEAYWVRPSVQRWWPARATDVRTNEIVPLVWPPEELQEEFLAVDAFAAGELNRQTLLQSNYVSTADITTPAARVSDGSTKPTTTTTSTTTASPRPTMPPLRHLYKLRWTAEELSGVMDRTLNRFLHVYISLASPLAQSDAGLTRHDDYKEESTLELFRGARIAPPPPPWKVYDVLVALEETTLNSSSLAPTSTDRRSGSHDISSSSRNSTWSFLSSSSISDSTSCSSPGRNDTKYIYTYHASVTCWRSAVRCSNIVLPSNVVIPANGSRLTLTLIDIEAELAEATVRAAQAGGRLCTRNAPQRARLLAAPSAATTGVGVMFQRARYTIGTIVFRYVFLVITLISTLRFLYRSGQAQRMLFEQKWTLALQLGLVLYLNPLYWWCIYAEENARHASASGNATLSRTRIPMRGLLSDQSRSLNPRSLWHFALYYMEFHIPTYFVALTVCYIWGVIAGSFRWSSATVDTPASASSFVAPTTAARRGQVEVQAQQQLQGQRLTPPASTAAASHAAPPACVNVTLRDTGAEANNNLMINRSDDNNASISTSPADVTVPLTVTVSGSQLARRRVRVLLLLFMCLVTVLDTVKFFLEEAGPYGGWDEVTCRTTRCLQVQRCMLYVLVGGILSSGVGLYWLRRNLARHPYLSTRPQQLACRIMIFIYFTGGLYCVVQALLLETLYRQLMAIIYYQPLVQLSHLFVLTSFVNHMTYVYTTTQSSLQIPLRPSDPRWKTVGWSSRWYRWLDWHGGSLYVFFNEAEERRFYEVQVAYQLAKCEKKELRKERKQKAKRQQQQQQRQAQGNVQINVPNSSEPPGNADGAACASPENRQTAAAVTQSVSPPTPNRGWGFFFSSWWRGRQDNDDEHNRASGTQPSAVTSGRQAGQSPRDGLAPQATSQPTAPPLPPVPRSSSFHRFALSTNTLSALSEPEETDWLLLPDSALPERHRSLSTVTQASDHSSDSAGSHQHHGSFQHHISHQVSHGTDREEGVETKSDDGLDKVHKGCASRQGDVEARKASRTAQNSQDHYSCEANRRTPLSTEPSAMSPFPPSAMPRPVADIAHGTKSECTSGAGGAGDRFGPSAAPREQSTADAAAEHTELSTTKDRNASQRVFSRVSSRVLVALHGAESRLVDGTATFVDLLAEKCVDRPLQVLLRQRARQRFVFFNLETAIDCLNLSREAYAVQESKGDDLIRTGIQVDAGQVPRAALTLMERAVAALFGLCFNKSPLEAPTAIVERESEDAEAERVVAEGDLHNSGGMDASGERAPLLSVSAETPSLLPRQTSLDSGGQLTPTADKPAARRWTRLFRFLKVGGEAEGGAARQTEEAPVTPSSPPSREGATSTPTRQRRTSTAAPTPLRPPLSASPASPPTAASATTATPVRPFPAAPVAPLLPHMNIEQYGYTPVAVFDTRGVQVVIARMDVSGACPVHAGKPPRLSIAFRGTDNVANVLEDIRFRQRTWKEMETTALFQPRATVHSGFLELWMSLKEAVMEVVLRELRRQCEDEDGIDEDRNRQPNWNGAGGGAHNKSENESEENGDVPNSAELAAAAAAAAAVASAQETPGVGFARKETKATATQADVFRSHVPFSTRWSAPPSRRGPPGSRDSHRANFLRLYVTGHSLGGALACLCAYTLRRMLLLVEYPEPDIVVYTFGQPRIGNNAFKQHYNRAIPCTFRVVNESDVVSGFNILGGHHVGVQVNVDRHGNYICKPMYIERLLRPTRGRGLALLNHKLAAYAESLNAVADVYANGACPVRCLEPYMDEIESVSSTGEEDEEEGSDAHAESGAATTSAATAASAAVSSRQLPQREEVEED